MSEEEIGVGEKTQFGKLARKIVVGKRKSGKNSNQESGKVKKPNRGAERKKVEGGWEVQRITHMVEKFFAPFDKILGPPFVRQLIFDPPAPSRT